MNRDNLLFALLGLVIGFISAYWMFEAMAVRQPARLAAGSVADPHQGLDAEQAAAGGPGPAGPAAGGGAVGGGAPMMEEIQRLRAAVEKNPNDAEAVLRLANANFDIRNWPRAQELYTQFLKLEPNQPDVLTDLGITYRETGQFDQALAQFKRAQEIAPGHWQSRFNEVVVLAFNLKQFDRADAVLAELRRLQPDNTNVQELAAEVERQRNAT